ncbi:hypothetical protein [Maribacter cobaltidurans]|uniref:Uncharacterized protein n=1 Tax=Maribacter cobaltidurans TaxID=1178778 RepID=A0A223V2V7_9FLAO|nr:hypothetical protein [Maribacter cobaltidurans]ASV29338.1 hypothetical protein CJ263_03385 [Maribacter cobaltidurans]GGD69872.1 hypothetical protein GCM10011412_04320 [Maribacter cobaltidurans]
MKKILNFAYLGIFVMALSFTSCQDEFEEISTGEDQTAITASSSTGILIQNTTARDGSFDNIVDGTSCYDVKFPYTVEVNGLELTINSREDLKLIEEIFDEVDDDEDFLEILFPITITSGDFTEITINGFEDLKALREQCKEGGEDDDIECIDFVYPMTLYTFDINLEQTGEVMVKSDMELRLFFKGLEDNELVSFDFPIMLELYDGSKIEVNSNEELAMNIRNAKDACDEDDDNDYNDDDFTEEELDGYLVSCPWHVLEVIRDDVDQSPQYLDYFINFKEDGSVVVTNRTGFEANGTWTSSMGDNGAMITMNLEALTDFSMEWTIYKTEEGIIKFYNGERNRIRMRRYCEEDGAGYTADNLRNILKECAWVIKKVKNQGEEIDRLLGYEFKFMPEGVITLSNGVNTSEGTWEIGLNMQQQLAMSITMGDEPGVSFEWPVRELTESRLKFEVDEIDYELVLQRVCEDNAGDADVLEIRNYMMGGDWVVASYVEGDMDKTESFMGYSTAFMVENQIELKEGGTTYANGLWRVLRNKDGQLKVYLNFGDNAPFLELTEDWDYVSIVEGRLELKDVSGDGTVSVLVLEK